MPPRNRPHQNIIGTIHITDAAEAAIAAQASVTAEQVEDFVGGMLGGTQTFISVSYDDVNGNLEYIVPVKDEDNMASNSATHLVTQQSIKVYVDTELANLVDSSPAALNTLNELAAALGDDANFSTTMTTALGNRLRVDTASQGLSTTQQANAIDNLGITASKAEINILDGGLSASDIPNIGASKITSGTFATARIADDAITAAKLNVTGNGSSTQFLRSDGDGSFTWAVPVDTQYSVGDGGLTQRNFTSTLKDKLDSVAMNANNYSLSSDLLDEDNMASNSATKAASQQSIKAYVDTQVAGLVDSAPSALNTLNELAAALGDDASFSTTVSNNIGTKLAKSSNLSDLTNVGTARTNLGLGSAATKNTGSVADGNAGLVTGDAVYDYIAAQNYATSGASNFVIGDITGQTALTSGLASTDELVLSDAGALKRMDISVLQSYMQSNLTFTTNTQLNLIDEDDMATNSATRPPSQQSVKAYVDAEVAGIVDSAPTALNTLNELAAALGDDANYAATTTTALGQKLVKTSNLSDLSNAGIARNNLGLDTAATYGVAPNNASGVANGQGALVTGNAVYQYVTANGGDSWGDAVDANIVPDNNNSRTLGSPSKKFGSVYFGGTSYNTLLSSADGSAGYPTYTFEYDENTGMYRAGTDILGFSTAGSSRMTIGADGAVNFVASKIKLNDSYGSNGQVLTSTGSGVQWASAAGGDVVDDTSPQLGGNLDTQGFYLQSSTSNKTVIKPGAGSGNPQVSIGDDSANPGVLRVGSNGVSNALPLAVSVLNTSNSQTRTAGYFLAGLSSGTRAAGFGPKVEFRASSGTAYSGQVSATISTTQIGAGESANHDLRLEAGGTGSIRFNNEYTFPAVDGSANQYLKTDGSGTLSWSALSSGASVLGDLTDVLLDDTNFTDSILIQTDSDGSAPTTGTLSSATGNVGIGKDVFESLTSGSYNVVLGYDAGDSLTSGENHVFIGRSAGAAATVGSAGSVMIGNRAGEAFATSSGWPLLAIGESAGQYVAGANNTFIGYQSGVSVSGTSNIVENTAVGYQSLKDVRNGGSYNTALGAWAGWKVTTGTRNTLLGYRAGDNFDTESDNIAIGYEAMGGPVAGAEKTIAIGSHAGDALTSGSGNILVGHVAGSALTTSSNNIAIGLYAMDAATTGWGHNIAIGYHARGQTSQTGGRNIALGSWALNKNSSDYGNIAIGYNSLPESTGHYNTAIGDQAGRVLTSGNNNTILGWNSAYNLTTGGDNIFIGKEAGDNITTGSNNLVIGKADVASATGSSQLSISNGSGSVTWITGDSSGHVSLGNYAFNADQTVGSSEDNFVLTYDHSAGTIGLEAAGGGSSGAEEINDLTDAYTGSGSIFLGSNPSSINSGSHNAGVGENIMQNITTGDYNTGMGRWALAGVTTGSFNTAFGYAAGQSITTQTEGIVAIGHSAGKTNVSSGNTLVGARALENDSAGSGNTVMGHWAMQQTENASSNVAIGYFAMYGNSTITNQGDSNVAVGHSALRNFTYAKESIAVGASALYNTTSGNYNVAMGHQSLTANTTGNRNIGIGWRALYTTDTESDNIGIGYEALKLANGGEKNLAIGNYAGDALTTGAQNILLGNHAGGSLTTSNQNIAIGVDALKSLTTGSRSIAIGYEALKTNTGGMNTAIGWLSMNNEGVGNNNIAIGDMTMQQTENANSNVVMGNFAGYGDSSGAPTNSGDGNTAIGHEAMRYWKQGSHNTALGYQAYLGTSNTANGSKNIAIGWTAGNNLTSGSNNVVIGAADVTATGDSQLKISSGDGNVTWIEGSSGGVVNIPGSLTVAGSAVGGGTYAGPPLKTEGYNWYGSQSKDIRTTSLPPYGTKSSTIFTMNTSSQWDKTMFFPFIAPKTGNVSTVMAYVQSGASGLNLLVGLYSDSNGYPANLLYKCTLDCSSGGNKTATSFTDSGGNSVTFALTKDTQYHWGFVRDDATTQLQIYAANGQYSSNSGLNLNMSDAYVGAHDVIIQYGGSDNTLAASYGSGSPTWDDFTVLNSSVHPPSFGIRYS